MNNQQLRQLLDSGDLGDVNLLRQNNAGDDDDVDKSRSMRYGR